MIKVRDLTKYYGKRLAVDHISFNVEKGEIVGFLGPNAAGKTTTMRMLTGFLAPTLGDAWIGGHNVMTNSLKARQHIGYLPESIPLYTDMTVRAYLDYMASLRGLENSRIKSRIEEVKEICHLEEYIDVIIGKLSKGFRQRVGVAQAIIHEPEVLILDEPTVGIDPIQVSMTRQLIRDLGKDHTILLSSHVLPEISVICERVIIIHKGRIIAQDSIEKLSALVTGSKRLRMEVSGPAEKVTERLIKVSGIKRVIYQDRHHIVECASGQDPRQKIMESVVQGGWAILSMESVDMSLEDIFLKLTSVEREKK